MISRSSASITSPSEGQVGDGQQLLLGEERPLLEALPREDDVGEPDEPAGDPPQRRKAARPRPAGQPAARPRSVWRMAHVLGATSASTKNTVMLRSPIEEQADTRRATSEPSSSDWIDCDASTTSSSGLSHSGARPAAAAAAGLRPLFSASDWALGSEIRVRAVSGDGQDDRQQEEDDDAGDDAGTRRCSRGGPRW